MKKLILLSATVASTLLMAGGDIAPVEPEVEAAPSMLSSTKIEIYGVGHLSFDSIDNGQNTTSKIASNSSRIGIKASTEISDGLTILGQYEAGVDLTGTGYDDGNGGDFDSNAALFTSARDSFVGIKGNFGTVLAGNLPAVNQWMYDYNLFADQVGDVGNIWGPAGVGVDRASDTIAYFIPSFVEGLSGDIAYVSDLSDFNDGDSVTAILVKANYENSGLKLGVGYLSVDDDLSANDASDLAITGSYTMGNFSIGGGYVMSENVGGGNTDRDSYSIGGSYTMNNATLKTQYTAVEDDVADSDASMIAVGLDYALSKNTTIYVAYAQTDNDALAAYNSNNWGHGKAAYGSPAAGDDSQTISGGLVYKFNTTMFDGK